jgi:hypothetical protein
VKVDVQSVCRFIINEVCTPVVENEVWDTLAVFAFSLKPLISDNLEVKIVFLRHNLQESKSGMIPAIANWVLLLITK